VAELDGPARQAESAVTAVAGYGVAGYTVSQATGALQRQARYNCYGARMNHGTARCISVGNRSADAAVGAEVLRVLASLGIEAALRRQKDSSSWC
jgi:hypothetical protein